jgi:hypothetical protein
MLNIMSMNEVKSFFKKSVSPKKTDLLSYNVPSSNITVTYGPVTDRPGYTIRTDQSFDRY